MHDALVISYKKTIKFTSGYVHNRLHYALDQVTAGIAFK